MAVRSLSMIANEIETDWGDKISPYATESLAAMKTLNSIKDDYYADSASRVVGTFLTHARGWQGPVAKRVKAELRTMLGE